jgi:hypothetical protein
MKDLKILKTKDEIDFLNSYKITYTFKMTINKSFSKMGYTKDL